MQGNAFSTWLSAVGMVLALGVSTKLSAAPYDNKQPGPYGNGGNWMTAATWNPNTGVPNTADTVNLYPANWPAGLTLTADAGWGANTVNVIANNGNDCLLSLSASGSIGTLNWNDTANWYSWRVDTPDGKVLTLTQLNDNGPYTMRTGGGLTGTWSFTGAAGIKYNTNGTANRYAGMLDFSGATSVNLARNTASNTFAQENISTWAGSNNAWQFTIGRSDNLTQNWTVAANSHPALMPGGSSQDSGIRKVGSGDVNMAGVDLIFDLTQTHPADDGKAISASGIVNGGIYSGTVYANSVSIPKPTTGALALRQFQVLGNLVLDGQGGLQAGGSGNGRAFSAIAGDNNMEIRANYYPAGAQVAVGKLTVAPGGGLVYLDSAGTGKVKFSINNNSRDVKTYVNNAELLANDIYFGPKAYLSDRNDWSDAGSPGTAETDAGGGLEVRGRFLNSSTLNTDWRTEHTTLRLIGGGGGLQTLEAPSNDLGTAGPGASNFLFDKLILGKDSSGATSYTYAYLNDLANNAPGTGTEAVYVNTLELWGGSILALRGIDLYYRNGGANWIQAVGDPLTPFTFNGGFGFVIIPEPATLLSLVVAAGIGLAGRRRRT